MLPRLFLSLLFLNFAFCSNYTGFEVFRILPQTEKDVELLEQFEHDTENYNFWKDVTVPNRTVDLMVSPEKKKSFLKSLLNSSASVSIYINDVQKFLTRQIIKESNKISGRGRINKRGDSKSPVHFDWTSYHTLDEIYNWMKHLEKMYPDNVRTFVVGKTFENEKILGLKISTNVKKDLKKKSVFIEGGIHAREWISPAIVTYVIKKVLGHKTDNRIRQALPLFDWYFVPVLNPDGYKYSFNEKHRFWRKNKSYNKLKNLLKPPECIGVDLNRNWNFKWRESLSEDKCEETYPGPKAFSEEETSSLSQFLKEIKDRLAVYVAFHSYGQAILFPFGYDREKHENYDEHKEVGLAAVKALEPDKWTVETSVEFTSKPSRGISIDWVKGVLQVPFAFTYELPDRGNVGFHFPASKIISVGEKIIDSLDALLAKALFFINNK